MEIIGIIGLLVLIPFAIYVCIMLWIQSFDGAPTLSDYWNHLKQSVYVNDWKKARATYDKKES